MAFAFTAIYPSLVFLSCKRCSIACGIDCPLAQHLGPCGVTYSDIYHVLTRACRGTKHHYTACIRNTSFAIPRRHRPSPSIARLKCSYPILDRPLVQTLGSLPIPYSQRSLLLLPQLKHMRVIVHLALS